MTTDVEIVRAIYRQSGVGSSYDGNALIEALPRIMTTEESADALSFYPRVEPSEFDLLAGNFERHCVGRLYILVQAAPQDIDVHSSFDELVAGGYVGRNPFNPQGTAPSIHSPGERNMKGRRTLQGDIRRASAWKAPVAKARARL